MKTRNAAIAAALLVASLAGTADAGFVIDVSQAGSNVVAAGSGSIDLTGLSFLFSGVDSSGVNPGSGLVVVGPSVVTSVDVYSGATGPISFGGGGFTHASSGNGDLVGIEGIFGDIVVPEGYVSLTPLSGNATWDNTTIAGLGLTPGIYTYTWGAGGPAQSLTVNIVPEPSSLAMAGMAVAAGLIAARRRCSRPNEERAR
jgi:hypothetical protein